MATKEDIIILPAPQLRKASRKVGVVDDTIHQVISDMKSATLDWENSRPHEVGVALAAIQIDKPVKIVIIRNNFDDKKDKKFVVLINPEIVKLDGPLTTDYEGCLSVKNIYGKVPRYNKVKVRALDENGQEVRFKAEGFLARVLQHEIDHTKGIVFPDHIQNNQKAFYKLTKDGKLEKMPYETAQKAGIFRD